MAVHFNWTQMIPGVDHHNTHVATAAVVTGCLILFCSMGRLALGNGEKAVIPAGKFSIKGIFEFLIELNVGLCETVLGKNGRKYVPLFASVFTFILVNLIYIIFSCRSLLFV
ncbi:MAG: hypothetical protein HRT44_12535 [Bdellovibrionales bacterium]|nr:hypothetical protein [Bdellovibrionales bacterium]NQZ20065.1 hypothetical protein [Bdellovibrionales bacterium]